MDSIFYGKLNTSSLCWSRWGDEYFLPSKIWERWKTSVIIYNSEGEGIQEYNYLHINRVQARKWIQLLFRTLNIGESMGWWAAPPGQKHGFSPVDIWKPCNYMRYL